MPNDLAEAILAQWVSPTWLWSVRLASERTGCSKRAARRAFRTLMSLGKIEVYQCAKKPVLYRRVLDG